MGVLKCHQNILAPILIGTCVFTQISNAFWCLKVSHSMSEILLTGHLPSESTILRIQRAKGLSLNWIWTLFNGVFAITAQVLLGWESRAAMPTRSHVNWKQPGLEVARSPKATGRSELGCSEAVHEQTDTGPLNSQAC